MWTDLSQEQRDALNIPEIPSEYDSSAAPTIPFSEGQFIRIADFKPEPELDQVAQDYFDGKRTVNVHPSIHSF